MSLSYLETAFKDLFGFSSTDSAMHGNLFITPDTERSDGVSGLGKDGCLAGQRLQNLSGTSQTITTLTYTDVQAQFSDVQIPHGILGFSFGHHSETENAGY